MTRACSTFRGNEALVTYTAPAVTRSSFFCCDLDLRAVCTFPFHIIVFGHVHPITVMGLSFDARPSGDPESYLSCSPGIPCTRCRTHRRRLLKGNMRVH